MLMKTILVTALVGALASPAFAVTKRHANTRAHAGVTRDRYFDLRDLGAGQPRAPRSARPERYGRPLVESRCWRAPATRRCSRARRLRA